MSSHRISEQIVTLATWREEEDKLIAHIEWSAKLLKLQRKALKAHHKMVSDYKVKNGIYQAWAE